MEITKQRSLPSDTNPPPTSRAPWAAWGDGERGGYREGSGGGIRREPEPLKGFGGGGGGEGEAMDF
jgi:hypothetical protein